MRPLRVFHVITRMTQGGARQVVLRLLEGLDRKGFDQTLVSGPLGDDDGYPRIVIPGMVREVSPRRDLAVVARLSMLFERRRPHVVHAHTYKAGVLSCFAARLSGVGSIIFTPHGHIFARDARIPGVPSRGWKLELLRWLTRAAQSCAHRVTALSPIDLEEQLALALSPASKYQVIRNGIDADLFDASPPPGGPLTIGAVGRFTSEKGHLVLVRAFPRVLEKHRGARLVLVGSGEMEERLREEVARLGIARSVLFTGERDSVGALPEFHLFVQPSLYESQGLAILEAMAAGRPVVATDVGGVSDVVQDGVTGLLVPPDDPGRMADAILRLAGDRRGAAEMAERARDLVREGYTARRMVEDYAQLYRRLAGRYNSRSCTTT